MTDLARTRIVFVNNYPGDSVGGGEVQLLALIDACLAAGMRVEVVSQSGSALSVMASAHGAIVFETGFSANRLPLAIRAVRHVIDSGAPAIVQGTGYLTNLVARFAASRSASKVVNVLHVEPTASLFDGGSKIGLAARAAVDRATARRVNRFVAVSRAVAEGVAKQLRMDRSRFRIIHNGVDAAALAEAATHSRVLDLNAGNGPCIGTVARLERVKGVADFIVAAATVLRELPETRFVVAGTGSQESELRAKAAAYQLGDKLRFLGYVSSASATISALDVFVMPSLSEGLGIAALEAMALGKPVVATRIGGLPEVVEDGVTGLLVPPSDPSALAEALLAVLSDPARAQRMGEAGRKRVERDFTLERMTREYLDLYAELLAEQGSPRA